MIFDLQDLCTDLCVDTEGCGSVVVLGSRPHAWVCLVYKPGSQHCGLYIPCDSDDHVNVDPVSFN